jgi:serine/threonine-protein kinase RsbW
MNAYASQAQQHAPAAGGKPAVPGQAPPRPAAPRGREAGRPASPNAAPDVRRYVLRALFDTPRMCRAMTRLDAKLWGIADPGDLEAITGELVANAVEATAHAARTGHLRGEPVIVFRLLRFPGRIRVEAWDKSPLLPQMRTPDWEAESGRGLCVVNSLTDGHWGYQADPQGTEKCVWADMRTPSP